LKFEVRGLKFVVQRYLLPFFVNKKDFSIETARCTIYLYRQFGKRNIFIASRFTNTEN